SGYGYKKVEFEKKINQGQLVAYPSFVVYEQRINRSFIQGMVVSIVEDDLYDDRGSAVTRTPIPFEAGKKDIQVKVQVKGDDIGDSKKEAEIILNFEAEVIDLRREEEDGEDPGQPGGEPVPYPG